MPSCQLTTLWSPNLPLRVGQLHMLYWKLLVAPSCSRSVRPQEPRRATAGIESIENLPYRLIRSQKPVYRYPVVLL